MGLQQYERMHCSNSCTSQSLALGRNDEHPKSAVKCPFIGLVKTLVAVIEWQKRFKSEQSLYGNRISKQACPFPRA